MAEQEQQHWWCAEETVPLMKMLIQTLEYIDKDEAYKTFWHRAFLQLALCKEWCVNQEKPPTDNKSNRSVLYSVDQYHELITNFVQQLLQDYTHSVSSSRLLANPIRFTTNPNFIQVPVT